jgi:hypothetical protein
MPVTLALEIWDFEFVWDLAFGISAASGGISGDCRILLRSQLNHTMPARTG